MNGAATEYFDWLVSKVYDITNQRQSYMNLLWYLFGRPFNWPDYIPMDENRAIEGILLRRRFEDEYGIDLYELDQQMRGYCSWLEMLVALCIRVEDQIMSDNDYGNRTGEWFWIAINNLGLNHMWNGNLDENYVDMCLTRFEERQYNADGTDGGLYILEHPGPNQDMRYADVWYQINWYLSERYAMEDFA